MGFCWHSSAFCTIALYSLQFGVDSPTCKQYKTITNDAELCQKQTIVVVEDYPAVPKRMMLGLSNPNCKLYRAIVQNAELCQKQPILFLKNKIKSHGKRKKKPCTGIFSI